MSSYRAVFSFFLLLLSHVAFGGEINNEVVQEAIDEHFKVLSNSLPHVKQLLPSNDLLEQGDGQNMFAGFIQDEEFGIGQVKSFGSKLSTTHNLKRGKNLEYGFKLKKKKLMYLEYTFQ